MWSMSVFVLADEIESVQQESELISQSINDWNNTFIKQQLITRYKDNKCLLEFITQHKGLAQESDAVVDELFKEEVDALIQDQEALNYFTENLISISEVEKLDLDDVLQRKKLLYKQYEGKLNEMMGQLSARILLNRILYVSLMEKYANT